MKRLKSTLVVLLVFSVVLVSFPHIEEVKAQGTIYIKGDGSVEGTDKIKQTKGNIYTFTDNISGVIVVQRGNCVIDGAGYTLQGNWSGFSPDEYVMVKGIDLSNNRMSEPSRSTISGVTIKNMRIVNFTRAIECVNSRNNTVSGCYIADCAISINQPSDFLIANNTLECGIFIDYTNADNTITKNNLISDGYPAEYLVGVFLAAQPTVYMNYWSDYNGTDNNGDGIGDTPYIINDENQDNYPLMNPVEAGIIPEFPSWIILPIFFAVSLSVIVFRKKLAKNTN
jgi:hypothetical protein